VVVGGSGTESARQDLGRTVKQLLPRSNNKGIGFYIVFETGSIGFGNGGAKCRSTIEVFRYITPLVNSQYSIVITRIGIHYYYSVKYYIRRRLMFDSVESERGVRPSRL